MVQFTVEETNLMSIYHEGGKAQLMENMIAALPYSSSHRVPPLQQKWKKK